MNVFTKIALASTGMVEIKLNQAWVILYIQGRAIPSKLERFVTFWSFPRCSNILPILTAGRGNRLTICQIRYKNTNSGTVILSEQDEITGSAMALKKILRLFRFWSNYEAKDT